MEQKTYTPDMVMGPPRKGIKLSYVTDTRPTGSILENVRDSDLFICEGMYGDKEKAQKARQYRHMTMYEAAKLSGDAMAKETWLTHYSPSMAHPGEYIGAVRKINPNIIVAKDGQSTTLRFEEGG